MLNVPDVHKSFINSIKRKCKYHNVKLILSPSKQVVDVEAEDYENECSGYFSGHRKLIVVACGKEFYKWIEVLVHESCHMDQWLQDPRWNKWEKACGSLGEYLLHKPEVEYPKLIEITDSLVELELDCEKRSVAKMIKWGLDDDLEQYIQAANAYIYSYRLIFEYGRFPSGMAGKKDIYKYAPKTFQDNYEVIPARLEPHIRRHFESLLKKAA